MMRTKMRNDANEDANYTKKIGIAVLGVMFVAYVGHNMFIFDTFNSYLMFFITIGYISYRYRSHYTPKITPLDATTGVKGRNKGDSKASIEEDRISKQRRTAAIILILLVFFTIWKTAVIPAKANYAATFGIVYGKTGDFAKSIEAFKKSLSYKAIQGEYIIRHYLARTIFRMFSATDNPEKKFGVAVEDLRYAIEEVSKNIRTDPLDPIPHLYVARLNEFVSRVEQKKNIDEAKEMLNEAERLLNRAKELNSKNPYIYFELGQVQIFKGNLEEAIDFFEQGISIKPEVELGYWYKGVTLLDMGKIEKGEEFIKKAEENGYKKSISDIRRLLRIYVPLKDYPAIIELYLEAIKLEPKNAQFYASLATAYKENGEIDKAIEAAKMVGELDPSKKAEAEAWIEMIQEGNQ